MIISIWIKLKSCDLFRTLLTASVYDKLHFGKSSFSSSFTGAGTSVLVGLLLKSDGISWNCCGTETNSHKQSCLVLGLTGKQFLNNITNLNENIVLGHFKFFLCYKYFYILYLTNITSHFLQMIVITDFYEVHLCIKDRSLKLVDSHWVLNLYCKQRWDVTYLVKREMLNGNESRVTSQRKLLTILKAMKISLHRVGG